MDTPVTPDNIPPQHIRACNGEHHLRPSKKVFALKGEIERSVPDNVLVLDTAVTPRLRDPGHCLLFVSIPDLHRFPLVSVDYLEFDCYVVFP